MGIELRLTLCRRRRPQCGYHGLEYDATGVCVHVPGRTAVPPPFYKMTGRFDGNVDRLQIVDTIVPCYTDVDAGCNELGRGTMGGKRKAPRCFTR